MDCGAYGGEQIFLTTMTAHTLTGNYRLGSVRLVSRAVYTNTAPNGAFRACNGVYYTFALERHTDEICDAHRHGPLGVPPPQRARRRRPRRHRPGLRGRRPRPMLERMEALRGAAPGAAWPTAGCLARRRRSARGSSSSAPRPRRSTSTPTAARPSSPRAWRSAPARMVQALPQIVADRLGHAARRTSSSARRTRMPAATTWASAAAGPPSRSARRARRRATRCAASSSTPPPTCSRRRRRISSWRTGLVSVVGAPGQPGHRAAGHRARERDVGPISGTGSFTAPGAGAMPGCAAGHMIEALDLPVFAVHECDVAVDPDTGHVEVLDYRVVQDVGRAINPRAIHGQIQGGVVQGLGYALHEELTLGADGRSGAGGLRDLPAAARGRLRARCGSTCTRARRHRPVGREGRRRGPDPQRRRGGRVRGRGRDRPARASPAAHARPGARTARRRRGGREPAAPRAVVARQRARRPGRADRRGLGLTSSFD